MRALLPLPSADAPPTLWLAGDLDLTTTSALARQLDVWVRGVDTASAPLIDVSRVTFMDLARPSPVAASGTGARPRLVKDVE